MKKIVLLRHGESIFNKENRFTGWTDVDLSAKGLEEAKNCGRLLLKEHFVFDVEHINNEIRMQLINHNELQMKWVFYDIKEKAFQWRSDIFFEVMYR